MSDTNDIVEGAPGAARAWRVAREQALAIHAVPRYEALTIGLENGWDCHLEPYQYQPLNEPGEIRLLRIFPWTDRLQTMDGLSMPRCELIHVNLNSSPEYAAISYAWGNLLEHSPVTWTAFRLHSNSLFETICWASVGAEEPLDFWADQICINQHDLVERSKEVKLMGRIYKQASLTFVWLGASNETDELAFNLIKKLSLDDLPLVKAFDLCHEKDVNGLPSILQPYGIDCNNIEPVSSSNGLQHIYEQSEEHVLIVKGKTVSTIGKVASHKFSEYRDEYHNGDIESFLGSRTVISQVLEALERC